jgi:hypothetical protein
MLLFQWTLIALAGQPPNNRKSYTYCHGHDALVEQARNDGEPTRRDVLSGLMYFDLSEQ